MTTPVGIDYDAFRVALVKLVRSIGFTQNQVIEGEPEIADPVRPARPYVEFIWQTPLKGYGRPQIRTDPDTKQKYAVEQGASWVDLNVIGNTHEEAFGLASALHTLMRSDPLLQMFADAGFPVWAIEDVANVSALLNTGYEGRANLQVQFGVVSVVPVQVDEVDSVQITGTGDVSINLQVHD